MPLISRSKTLMVEAGSLPSSLPAPALALPSPRLSLVLLFPRTSRSPQTSLIRPPPRLLRFPRRSPTSLPRRRDGLHASRQLHQSPSQRRPDPRKPCRHSGQTVKENKKRKQTVRDRFTILIQSVFHSQSRLHPRFKRPKGRSSVPPFRHRLSASRFHPFHRLPKTLFLLLDPSLRSFFSQSRKTFVFSRKNAPNRGLATAAPLRLNTISITRHLIALISLIPSKEPF